MASSTLSTVRVFAFGIVGSAPLFAQSTYSYDDGTSENAMSLPGMTETVFLHTFQVAGGGTDTITEVQVAIGSALGPQGSLDGNPLVICVWDDPSNDGHPFDAVLLYQSPVYQVTQSHTDVKVPYPVAPSVLVDGTFFVGALTTDGPGLFPVALDQTSADIGPNRAWAVGDPVAVDPAALSASASGFLDRSNAVFFVSANGGSGEIGTRYCTPGVVNSTGFAARITAHGEVAVNANDLELSAHMLPPHAFGYFLNSRQRGSLFGPGGSQGILCLGGAIGRHLNQVQNAGSSGTFQIQLDLFALPTPTGAATVTAGETWNFQGWFRDANPGATSNFTDAVSVSFE